MNTNELILAESSCKDILYGKLKDFVLEHGEEMCDYFRDEYGMDEEENEDVTITNVIDLASHGCYFALPLKFQTEGEDPDNDFLFDAFWSLYTVKDNTTGKIELKYYRFYNYGITFDDDSSEPDHDDAYSLSMVELAYIYDAVVDMYK